MLNGIPERIDAIRTHMRAVFPERDLKASDVERYEASEEGQEKSFDRAGIYELVGRVIYRAQYGGLTMMEYRSESDAKAAFDFLDEVAD